jgi:hypothetical protein
MLMGGESPFRVLGQPILGAGSAGAEGQNNELAQHPLLASSAAAPGGHAPGDPHDPRSMGALAGGDALHFLEQMFGGIARVMPAPGGRGGRAGHFPVMGGMAGARPSHAPSTLAGVDAVLGPGAGSGHGAGASTHPVGSSPVWGLEERILQLQRSMLMDTANRWRLECRTFLAKGAIDKASAFASSAIVDALMPAAQDRDAVVKAKAATEKAERAVATAASANAAAKESVSSQTPSVTPPTAPAPQPSSAAPAVERQLISIDGTDVDITGRLLLSPHL